MLELNGCHVEIILKVQGIKDIVECLEPVKLGVEALCHHDSDFYQAETNLKLILNQLKDRGTHLALELKCQIDKRIFKRRDRGIVSLIKYLFDPNSLHVIEENVEFKMMSKQKLIDVAKKLQDRLY